MTMTNGSEQPTKPPSEGNGGAKMALTSVNESTKPAESKAPEGCKTAEMPSYAPIRRELLAKPGASSSGYSGVSAGILWLDDVLSAQLPERLVTAVGRIITTRYERDLRTVVTTNMTPSQIAQKVGPAIASRLCGSILLHAEGQDSRLVQCAGPKAAATPST